MMEAMTLTSLMASYGGLVLMKSTLLLGFVYLASLVLRQSSASTQHYLWTLAFGALLALPVVAYVSATSPSWRIAVPVLEPPPSLDDVETRTAPGPSRATPRPVGRRDHTASPASARSFAPSTWALVWFLGSVTFLLRLVSGVWASRRARDHAEAMHDEAWLDLLGDAQARIGTLQDVDLRKSPASKLPMTIGVLRPSILLPDASETYSLQRRWAVLLHELAHVRRHDCLTQLVCQIACAIFWWHPLAWLGARKMRALSERASDDLVLDAGAKPSEYAHDLLDMARGLNLSGRSAPIASVTMAHRSRLEERLLAILDPAMARTTISSRLALPAALAGAGIALSVALAMPTVAVSPPQPTQEPKRAQLEQPPQEALPDTEDKDRAESDAERPDELSEAQMKARAALASALDDPSASVRDEALGALVRLGDERTVPHLLEALASGDAEARADAAWGLGQMRRGEAASALIQALSDADANVREQTAWSLGMLRSNEAVDALSATVTSDSSSNAREQAAWALGMIRNDAAVGALVDAIDDDNSNVRAQAAWALGMIRNARALPGLSQALQDENENVREQAIWAVGMLRSPESLDILVKALNDASAEIRGQAAWALGMLGDARAVDALSAALADDDEEVREQAAWALGRLAKNGDDDVDLDIDMEMDIDVEERDPDRFDAVNDGAL